ncbi:hypothetical protein HDU98_003326 [Podochytrium sp. JEL0797]|nr:hypothetical protein HDU98_003326 [Podochytrium sp. JEL0797]
MAGNIIPAISTTNAIIAGLMVLQAFKILNNESDQCKNTYLAHGGQRTQLVCGETPPAPNKDCGTCQAGYFTLAVDTAVFTLGEFVDSVLNKELKVEGEVTINEEGRMIYDPDFDDNASETFDKLELKSGKRVLVLVDNDDDASKSHVINVFVVHEAGKKGFTLDGDKQIPPRPVMKAATPEAERRPLEDGMEVDEGGNKKAKLDNGDAIEILDDDVIVL